MNECSPPYTHTHTHTHTHTQEKASPTFVGFANLPNQVFRKSVKRGFEFSLMVVGTSHTHTTVFNTSKATYISKGLQYKYPSIKVHSTIV